MKKVFGLLALMLALSITCAAQIEEEEAQLFGYTRSMSESKMLNIGKIGKDVITKEIVIENAKPNSMKIIGFILPTGISAMSMQKNIEDFGRGRVKITIDPSIADSISDEVIIINVVYLDRKGKEVELAQLPYKLVAE
ncbi:MAG: hypothetical protein II852_18365 [Bacteroidales bacterium]|jgi:hypothetical protein|nr:hypothetical protein [Bacteroidales bacterium]